MAGAFQDSAGSNLSVNVRGIKELNRAFALADRELAKQLRTQLREAAKPVAADAQQLAVQEIRNVDRGKRIAGKPDWSRMRVGYGYGVVYVAPTNRGRRTRTRPALARPNFGTLLMDRAMEPALEQNVDQITNNVNELLDRVERTWGNA